ncbi:hypothetical protein PVAP13_5NG455480 [Panicum virgatum]|uniref:Uncharacterized protein n=1 Tax=Panicum virgatum TaxID=38727 RepID=A0A8T0S121_PANVG|nr:hypothetical protein PVAP13_5NG455480 [Panicum virgatum]
MMSQPLLMRLILLAVVASAATAAGDGCSTGCNLALASYHIALNQNLTYIASLFDIDDYRKLEPYNNFWLPNLIDPIPAGTRVTVNFPCRCLALPTAPFSTYLAGSFPYIATNSYQNNNLDGRTVNVTVNCSCGYPGVPPDYKLFLTYPLGDGETLDSVEDKYIFRLQSEVGTRIVYIPLIGVSAIAPLPSPTDSPSMGPWKNKTTIMGNDR